MRERVLLPLIADLQFEHARASGRFARGRALIRGSAAFWRALASCIAGAVLLGATPAEIGETRRRFLHAGWAAGGFALVFVLDAVRQLRGYPVGLAQGVFILPSIALPALSLGVLFASSLSARASRLGQQRAVARLAAAAGLVTFVVAAWLAPLANQEYRERVFQAVTGNATRVPIDRGARELTLEQLSTRTAELRSAGRTPEVPPLQVEWHKKPALGVACAALALLGALIAETGWRRVWRGLAAFVFAVGLSVGFRGTERLADAGRLHPALAMWAPVAALGLLVLALQRAARMSTRAATC